MRVDKKPLDSGGDVWKSAGGVDLPRRSAIGAIGRRHWLDRAVDQLWAVPAVVAVWLWGSGGRGVDDALSDWDIFVAWADRIRRRQARPGWVVSTVR